MFPSNKWKGRFRQSLVQAESNFYNIFGNIRLKFNEFSDENDLKSNLRTKINQKGKYKRQIFEHP